MNFYGNWQVQQHIRNHNEHSEVHFSKLQPSSLAIMAHRILSPLSNYFLWLTASIARLWQKENEKKGQFGLRLCVSCMLLCKARRVHSFRCDGKRIANINFFQLLSEQPSRCVPINLSNRVNVKDGKFIKQKIMLQHENFFCSEKDFVLEMYALIKSFMKCLTGQNIWRPICFTSLHESSRVVIKVKEKLIDKFIHSFRQEFHFLQNR